MNVIGVSSRSHDENVSFLDMDAYYEVTYVYIQNRQRAVPSVPTALTQFVLLSSSLH